MHYHPSLLGLHWVPLQSALSFGDSDDGLVSMVTMHVW